MNSSWDTLHAVSKLTGERGKKGDRERHGETGGGLRGREGERKRGGEGEGERDAEREREGTRGRGGERERGTTSGLLSENVQMLFVLQRVRF